MNSNAPNVLIPSNTLCYCGLLYWILALLLLVSCGLGELCSTDEIIRQSSPDKLVDVIATRKNCGATTSYVTEIFITPIEKKELQNPIFLADKVENISILWKSDRQLLIYYSHARIFNFQNFWNSKEVKNFDYIVDIVERKRGT